jgi:Ribbon-helix-helix protein, copG family
MRISVELGDDVAALLDKAMADTGLSLSEAVNHYLRLAMTRPTPARKRFVVAPVSLNLPAGMSYDSISQLLEDLEGPTHR